MGASIRGDVKQITRHLRETERKVIPGAASAAITGTVRDIRKRVLKQVRVNHQLPAREVNKRARVRRAKPKDWRAWIWWNTLNVNPGQAFVPKQTKQGVRAGKYVYPRGFVRTGRISSKPVIFIPQGAGLSYASLPVGATGERLFQILVDRGASRVFRRLFAKGLRTRLQKLALKNKGTG